MSDAAVAELFQETEIKPGMGENILTQRLILHTYQSQCRTGKNVGLSDKDTSTIPVCFDTLQISEQVVWNPSSGIILQIGVCHRMNGSV